MISIEGFVLAGGRSRRMGRDKSNLLLGGKTLIDRAATALSAIADPIYAVGNLTSEITLLPIIHDEIVGGNARGAIVGLYSALLHARADWAAILACDLPFVSGELLQRMAALTTVSASGSNGVAVILPRQPDGRIQPLCGLYQRGRCLAVVEQMLADEKWRLQDLPERVTSHIIPFAEISDLRGAEHFFDNLNTPDDYEAAIATLY